MHDAERLASIAAEELPQDAYAWTVEALPVRGAKLTAEPTPAVSEPAELVDSGTGAFILRIGEHVIPDFEYDAPDQPELIRQQLGRIRAYLDGQVQRAEKRRGDRLVAVRLQFPGEEPGISFHGGITSIVDFFREKWRPERENPSRDA
jgi:hypothetical protein